MEVNKINRVNDKDMFEVFLIQRDFINRNEDNPFQSRGL
jgi:hypothetical protein